MTRLLIILALIGGVLYYIGFDFVEKGFKVSVPAKDATATFSTKFPMDMNFSFGRLILNQPKILSIKDSNRLNIVLQFSLISDLIPSNGKLLGEMNVDSGIRYDNEEKRVYLQDLTINKMHYNDSEFMNYMPPVLDKIIAMLIRESLTSKPLYNIGEKNPILSKVVKNVIVENGNIEMIIGW